MGLSFYIPTYTIGGIDSYTKLMLHMDGADDGTTFTDDSAETHSITRVNALTKTGTKKFGTASGYFDGNNDYLSLPDSTDWDFGTDDFTIDFWFYRSSKHSIADVILGSYYGFGTVGEYELYANIYDDYKISMSFHYDSWPSHSVTQSDTYSLNVWHHAAIVRNGTNISLYIDGISKDSITVPSDLTVNNPYDSQRIGATMAFPGTYDYVGYLDEFRISKGKARWTTNFTPESGPYTT